MAKRWEAAEMTRVMKLYVEGYSFDTIAAIINTVFYNERSGKAVECKVYEKNSYRRKVRYTKITELELLDRKKALQKRYKISDNALRIRKHRNKKKGDNKYG